MQDKNGYEEGARIIDDDDDDDNDNVKEGEFDSQSENCIIDLQRRKKFNK